MQAGLCHEDNKSLLKINNSHEEHGHIANATLAAGLLNYFVVGL
jgi:hypothetical protein